MATWSLQGVVCLNLCVTRTTGDRFGVEAGYMAQPCSVHQVLISFLVSRSPPSTTWCPSDLSRSFPVSRFDHNLSVKDLLKLRANQVGH